MRCLLPILAALPLCVLCGGCRKAKIDAPSEPLEPAVQVRQLPQAQARKEGGTWYRDLMPTASQTTVGQKGPETPKKAGEEERPWVSVETTIEPLDPTKKPPEKPVQPPGPPVTVESAQADAQALVEELRTRIEAARRDDASRCLLRLELSALGSGKKAGLRLTGDVGWTDLYVVRPEILFEQLRFEDCMNRLARMAGLRYAQQRRWGNPLVTWRGERTSVYEAVRAIVKDHGFAARFVSGGTRLTLDLSKYDSREQFMEKATESIVGQGRQLRGKLPTMLISIAPKASEAAEGTDPKEKAAGNAK